MPVKILKQEKNVLEMDLGDVDQSIAQLLVEKLNDANGVEFAAYKVAHPVVGTPCIIVRTKTDDPVRIVTKLLDKIKEEVEEFKKQFSEIAK